MAWIYKPNRLNTDGVKVEWYSLVIFDYYKVIINKSNL